MEYIVEMPNPWDVLSMQSYFEWLESHRHCIIVRCKDCKHYCDPNCFRLLDDNCTGVAIAMPKNGFCSFGER